MSWVSQDLLSQNPYHRSYMRVRPRPSRCFTRFEAINDVLKDLAEKASKGDWTVKLAAREFHLFLKLALYQSAGNLPVSRDLLKMTCKIGTISYRSSLKMQGWSEIIRTSRLSRFRVQVNSRFGVFYSNFLSLTPLFESLHRKVW